MLKFTYVGACSYSTLKLWTLRVAIALFGLVIPTLPVRSDPIASECRPHISPIDRISFADSDHKLWYITWWDGKCVGVGMFCSRITYWDTLLKPSLDHRHSTVDRNELVKSICTLGELVGLEWARNNSIRCVHTSDVKRWNAQILAAGADVLKRIEAVRSEADAMIGQAKRERRCAP